MLAACILWNARPAEVACCKLWAGSLLSQGRPHFTTPPQLLHYLHSRTQSITAPLPISAAPVPTSSSANQLLSTGCSTGRQQTYVASISTTNQLHAVTSSTGHSSLPHVTSASLLFHAAVQSAQESTLPSGLEEVKLPTSVPVPDKQLTTNPARLKPLHQQLCMAPWWLSSPAKGCSLTTSPLTDRCTSEGVAALQLDIAAYAQQRPAQLQEQAETRSLSIPAANLAGGTCTSSAASSMLSYIRPGHQAPRPLWGQTRQTQQPLASSHHARLHTTAGAASIPVDSQPRPQTSAVSATSEPQGGEKRQPARLQQHSAASQEGSQGGNEADRDSGAQAVKGHRTVLYKGRYMLAFRMLVRFKIFQLVGIAALAIPVNTFLAGGNISSIQMVMATALVIGCGVASTTLWWFSQRYVGEMSLVGPNKLCFSVLDFWGHRQDTVVSIDQLIPPMQRLSQKEKAELIHQTVFPLDVSADRQYLISLRHGVLVDKHKLVELLTEGTVSQQQ